MVTPDFDTIAGKAPNRSLWQELRDAIRGTEADYTTIGLGKAIFLLAVPMILELVMESTFAVADSIVGFERRCRTPRFHARRRRAVLLGFA